VTMHDILLATHQKLGVKDTEAANGAIAYLREVAKSPWQLAIINVIMDSVSRNGWSGVELAREAFMEVADGGNPDLSFLSPWSMNDILCIRQMLEADRKDRISKFFTDVGHVVGKVMKAVISSI